MPGFKILAGCVTDAISGLFCPMNPQNFINLFSGDIVHHLLHGYQLLLQDSGVVHGALVVLQLHFVSDIEMQQTFPNLLISPER